MFWNKWFFLFAVISISFVACKKNKSISSSPSKEISTSEYAADWLEVEAMEKKDLGKSIISRVNLILDKALAENNVTQIFKALAVRSKYSNNIEEDSDLKILTDFEQRIDSAEFPLKQLLHSAAADLYSQYYIQNRWKFNQRTKTIDFDEKDVRSWNLDKINSVIRKHYKLSLAPREDLLQFPTTSISSILQETSNSNNALPINFELRPSLYDFLAERALNYFGRNEGRLSKPIDEFQLNKYPIFTAAAGYAAIDFSTTDSNSNHYLSSKIYQKLVQAHLDDTDPAALVDFELNRLRFFRNVSKNEIRDSLYHKALLKMSKTYAASPSSDEIDFRIAQLYSQWGHQYSANGASDHKQWYLKKAYEICKRKEGKESFGAKQCMRLMQEIDQQSLSFQTEDTYLPNRSILYRFEYKNIDSVFFRLIKVPHQLTHQLAFQKPKDILEGLLGKKAIREWQEVLPNPGDFQNHSIEFYSEGLASGNYYLLACDNKNFDGEKEQFAFSNLKISQLSYFSRRSSGGDKVEVYIRNRNSGLPISKAKVVAYANEYDYSSRKSTIKKIGSFNSNTEGYVSFTSTFRNENLFFYILTEKDSLSSNSYYYLNSRRDENKTSYKTHWFTDRAIYRPGQTVYFKGIVIESNKNFKKAKPNYSTEVSLHNVNGEKLSTLNLSTNEYGSFQGSFVLPNGGLNGQYRIKEKRSSHYFSVEEYKRPSFKIAVDSSDKPYQINDSIRLSGSVKAFSGATISNAKLKYRVVRKASYPFWSYLRSFYPPRNQKEIANGTLITADDGSFQFDFVAQADPSTKAEWNPVFNYEITLDATSPSGETQSHTTQIQLSNQSLFLSSNLKDAIQLSELKKLLIRAENISGKAQKVKAKLSLWKLKAPKHPKKKKLWPKVDQQKLTEKQYQKLFPNYPLLKEVSIVNFPRELELTSSLINCNEELDLFGELKTGAYEIVVTANDQFGKEVEFKKRFVLFNKDANKPAYPTFAWFKAVNNKVEPGENAEIIVASSLKNLKLLYEIELENKVIKKEWISINASQRKISIPIKESYRGGFSIHLTAVHSDRMIRHTEKIDVPFSNKKLNIQLGTFRDKVLPGSKEKWTLTIAGHKGDAVAAELLASMYDQSLDQFTSREWQMDLYRSQYSRLQWDLNQSFLSSSSTYYSNVRRKYIDPPQRFYPTLNWFGLSMGNGLRYRPMTLSNESLDMDGITAVRGARAEKLEGEPLLLSDSNSEGEFALDNTNEDTSPDNTTFDINPIRSDFRETVFFYPQLKSNKEGKITFEFEMPDALTQWKFRALAHTKDLKVGQLEKSIQTQKELMVVPNSPRFFREGDELEFTAAVQNLSKNNLSGHAKLKFFDAINGDKIDIFSGNSADQAFNLFAAKNTVVKWRIKIPEGYDAIRYQIVAETKDYSDGEEKAIPVLPNRMLVTESLPLWIRGNESKEFTFEKLLHSKSEKTLTHENYALEFTPNPAWYAIQALPNLSESENECSEQVFSRLYANVLAEKIANSHPKIKAVFEQWKRLDSEELTSKLMQNQELKSVLIEETPWLQKAKDEDEQKRRIALLFDYNRMAQEKKAALQKLNELQLPNGSWSWYKGMRANRYITQYIVEGLGHLQKLGIDLSEDAILQQITTKAVGYLDNEIKSDYRRLKERKADMSKNHLGRMQIHYLYSRSFFKNIPFKGQTQSLDYFSQQAKSYWANRSIYEQALIALALNRQKAKSKTPQEIMYSLTDRALQSDEMGMYWKDNKSGYYWYQAAIETQALMIELYSELDKEKVNLEELKIWLLKQKQTQAWSNSKATASACYALLLNGLDLLATDSRIEISIGDLLINTDQLPKEAGTNYLKKVWSKTEVNSELANIKVSKQSDGIAWGAVYWQFYQDLDQISSANESSLKLSKTLFKQTLNEKGKAMVPIDITNIQVGDKITVRLRLETDRDLEFVHLKDMRASALEPTSVLSSYRYQDGLGYYQSTKDASTNFFMDWLPKGVYVFEYELRASLIGEFSNGISTIQCQYAPEFAAHSKGKRIKIKH